MPLSTPTTHRRSLLIGSRFLFLLLTGLIYLGIEENVPAATLNLSVKMVHCVTNSLPAWRVGFPNADCDLSYAHNFIDFTLASPTVVYCGDNADNTFAREGFTPLDGNNAFTAIAQDAYGGSDSNSIVVNLPLTTTFQYDLNGNLTNDVTHVLDYDDENQLVTNTVAGSWKSEFLYDGKMRRRIRREYSWQGGAWVKTNEVRYVYDGNLVLQERDSNNSGTMTYTRGLDLSGSVQGAGGIGGLLALSQPATINSQPAYYHADGNGNVTALVNQRQEIVARYLYDPFGNTLSAAGPMAAVNSYRFSSKEVHSNSDLVYYLYRFYQPSLQRWNNRDPLSDPAAVACLRFSAFQAHPFLAESLGGANCYSFAENAPTSVIDPFGFWGFTVALGASGGNWVGPAFDLELVYVNGKGWNRFSAAGGGFVTPGGEAHLYAGPIFNITEPSQYRRNFCSVSANSPPAGVWPGIGGGAFGWPFGQGSNPWGFRLGGVYGTPGVSAVWQWYKQWTGNK